jgi:predicted transcriptional regulator
MSRIAYHSIDVPSSRQSELSRALGRNVRDIRSEQRLSITTLTSMSGICRPLLMKIEKGESDVRLSYVERLSAALCVSPLELLTPKDTNMP